MSGIMKRILFLTAALLVALSAGAKKPAEGCAGNERGAAPQSGLVVSDGQILSLKTPPAFKNGGFDKYWKWVLSRVQYPKQLEENRIGGLVRLKIIVETDGTVSVDRVLESPDERFTEAVVRVVENSPKWTPGRMLDAETGEETAVRVSYVLPVEFKVRPQELVDPTTGRYQGQKNLKPYGS